MHTKPGQKGFSLIEMIISIAFIALSATIILQLFLVAAYRSDRGRNSDMALAHAQTALETFKGTARPEDILAMKDVLDIEWQEQDGVFSGDMFLSAGEKDAKAVRLTAKLSPDGEALDLPVSLNKQGGAIRTQLYTLALHVAMIRNGNEETLVDISAKKLFTFREAVQ